MGALRSTETRRLRGRARSLRASETPAKGGVEATTDSMSDGQALATAGELVELLGTISLTLAAEREPPADTE